MKLVLVSENKLK